jgi:hypothetical protein
MYIYTYMYIYINIYIYLFLLGSLNYAELMIELIIADAEGVD